ncbi:MAG: hypothetical protein KIPDCIKN_01967 [Haliscomenobacter sp.]|nr:hypothetical protein [Haliscomenobacter sp.]
MPVRIHRDQVFELLDRHDINFIESKIEFIDLVYKDWGSIFEGSREQRAGKISKSTLAALNFSRLI